MELLHIPKLFLDLFKSSGCIISLISWHLCRKGLHNMEIYDGGASCSKGFVSVSSETCENVKCEASGKIEKQRTIKVLLMLFFEKN